MTNIVDDIIDVMIEINFRNQLNTNVKKDAFNILREKFSPLSYTDAKFATQFKHYYQLDALASMLKCYPRYSEKILEIDNESKLNVFNALLFSPTCNNDVPVDLYIEVATKYNTAILQSALEVYIGAGFRFADLNTQDTYNKLSNINSEAKLTLYQAFGNNYLDVIANSSSDNDAIKGCITKYTGLQFNGQLNSFQLNALASVVEKVDVVQAKDRLILINKILNISNPHQEKALEKLLPPKDCGIKIDTKTIMDQALKYSKSTQIDALQQLGPKNTDLAVQFDTRNKVADLILCEKTKPYNKYSFLSEEHYNKIIGEASLSGDQTCGLEAKHFENY